MEFFERLWRERKMCAVMGGFVILKRETHKKTWKTILSCKREWLQSLNGRLSSKQVELITNNCIKLNSHQECILQTMWIKHMYFVCGEILGHLYLQQGVEIAHL